MKQTISIDQLMELTEEQKNKLRDMWEPQDRERVLYEGEGEGFYSDGLGKEGILPVLSIGQIIEILSKMSHAINILQFNDKWEVNYDVYGEIYRNDELVDSLLRAVKSIL